MAKREQMSSEQINEELSRVEQELRQLTLDYNDTSKINDDLTKTIELKEMELARKDQFVLDLRNGNLAEMEQMKWESEAVKERCNDQVNYHVNELHNLRIHKQRSQELQMENERLLSSVKYLEENAEKQLRQHALDMHEMNRSMKALRQQMENKIRRELTGLDINFQKQAFGALKEREKQAMFQNAKLKDEVAIQGIGISNLNARLARQKYAYDLCKREMSDLHEKSHFLKEKLSDVTARKNHLLRQKESFQNEYKSLQVEKAGMVKALKQHYHPDDHNNPAASKTHTVKSSPRRKANKETQEATIEDEDDLSVQEAITKELTQAYVSLKAQLRDARRHLQTWHHRHLAIQEILYEDLRATNEAERHGKYSEDDFPLYILLKQIERYRKELGLPLTFEEENTSPDVLPPEAHEDMNKPHNTTMAKWFDLKELMKEDEALKELLAPLLGTKESTIIVACHNAIHRSDDYLKEHHHFHSPEGGKEGHAPHEVSHEERRDQNIMAWVTLKILHLWYETKLRQLKPNRAEELELEMSEDAFEDRVQNGEMTEQELDDLREQAMDFAIQLSQEPSTPQHTANNDPLASSWFKKSKDNMSIMYIVAQETRRGLFPSNSQTIGQGSTSLEGGSKSTITDRSLPGAGMEIGPPVVARSALHYKEPGDSQTDSVHKSTSKHHIADSFSLDNTGKSLKKSQSLKTDLTQLSQLRDIDPFGKSKKSKKMLTMKAHLHNIHAKTLDLTDPTDHNAATEHHHTMPVSISASALQHHPASRLGQTSSNLKTHQSTGQLRGNNHAHHALSHTSHL